jgi:hypothetical protein
MHYIEAILAAVGFRGSSWRFRPRRDNPDQAFERHWFEARTFLGQSGSCRLIHCKAYRFEISLAIALDVHDHRKSFPYHRGYRFDAIDSAEERTRLPA